MQAWGRGTEDREQEGSGWSEPWNRGPAVWARREDAE